MVVRGMLSRTRLAMVAPCPSCTYCAWCKLESEDLIIYHVADGAMVPVAAFAYDELVCETCLQERGLLW